MARYAVSCLTDNGDRVRVTRRSFDTYEAAEHYAAGIANSREAFIYEEDNCPHCGGHLISQNTGNCSDCGNAVY